MSSIMKRVIAAPVMASATLAVLAPAPVSAQQECFLGEVRMFAGNFAPRNWALAEGQILPINTNQALYSIYGTTFGGDGRTTFALPDLRGRIPVGTGNGPGLTPRTLGGRFGSEQTFLNTNNLPLHTHTATTTATLNATTADGNNPAPAGNFLADDVNDQIYSTSAPNASMASAATTATTTTGTTGGQGVSNTQPSLAINHIVCLSGTFPSRN